MTAKFDITTEPRFNDDGVARAYFEKQRWPGGVPVCFHCGVVDDAVLVKRDEEKAAERRAEGKKTARDGLYHCRSCKENFTATMGTILEDSHIPMRKWLLAIHLMNASKKGVSATQLQRMLGLGSYRTAWFMAHRIREAMKPTDTDTKLGGPGKIVEADETYYGRPEVPLPVAPKGTRNKSKVRKNTRAVVALVERGGKSRVFHVGNADKATVSRIVRENVDPASRLHTDESKLYKGADEAFASHETVKHSAKEYVRGDVHTNSAEGFFGVFKKGMSGFYQHCGERYLQRYVTEFEFRHNHRVKLGFNDGDRAALTVKGSVGRRLTLRQPKAKLSPA
jgi:transposase-like protein